MKEGSPDGSCVVCGREWEPDLCPYCESPSLRRQSLEELMYDPDGMECFECERRWDGDGDTACPSCGSADVGKTYPEIPVLDEDLQLIYACEQRIPKDESGVHFPSEVKEFLSLHGVTDQAEIRLWADMWFAITSARGAATAKRLEDRKAEQSDDD